MCLAVPCRILIINGTTAEIEHGENQMSIDISLVPDVRIGQYVIVHAGMAIQVYDEYEAIKTIELINIYLNNKGEA